MTIALRTSSSHSVESSFPRDRASGERPNQPMVRIACCQTNQFALLLWATERNATGALGGQVPHSASNAKELG